MQPAQLKLLDLGSGRMTSFGSVDLGPGVSSEGSGFDVSPGGLWVIYYRGEESDSDIMLVENFR